MGVVAVKSALEGPTEVALELAVRISNAILSGACLGLALPGGGFLKALPQRSLSPPASMERPQSWSRQALGLAFACLGIEVFPRRSGSGVTCIPQSH